MKGIGGIFFWSFLAGFFNGVLMWIYDYIVEQEVLHAGQSVPT